MEVFVFKFVSLTLCAFQGVYVCCGQGPSSVLLVSTVCVVPCCARGLWHCIIWHATLRMIQSVSYVGVIGCMLWLLLWLAYGFKTCGRVTLWCPVFSQKEEVGVYALTESWTCFRP